MAKRPTGRPVIKVRIDDGEPRDVATLRLAWGEIHRAFADKEPGQPLTWSLQTFDGAFHREVMDYDEWRAFAAGPLAFQQRLEAIDWVDHGPPRQA